MSITIEPVSETFVAHVSGIDVKRTPAEETILAIDRAIDRSAPMSATSS